MPANIKVTPDGVVKVLDFGLAKDLTAQSSTVNPGISPTVTAATRAAVGQSRFSPELESRDTGVSRHTGHRGGRRWLRGIEVAIARRSAGPDFRGQRHAGAMHAAIAPDGSTAAYAKADGLWVRHLAKQSADHIVSSTDFGSMAWSPLGDALAFFDGADEVHIVHPDANRLVGRGETAPLGRAAIPGLELNPWSFGTRRRRRPPLRGK